MLVKLTPHGKNLKEQEHMATKLGRIFKIVFVYSFFSSIRPLFTHKLNTECRLFICIRTRNHKYYVTHKPE